MPSDSNEVARQAFGAEPAPAIPAAPRTRELADWWTRAGAYLLDQLVIFGIAMIAAVVALLVAGSSDERTVRIVVYAVAVAGGVLYPSLSMARRGARNGQTWGKQAVGLRVVRTNGEPITFWHGLLRTGIGQQLPMAVTFSLYALLDYLWPLRDRANQCLHDKLASTWVVHSSATAPPSPGTAWPDSARDADEVAIHGWLPPRAGG